MCLVKAWSGRLIGRWSRADLPRKIDIDKLSDQKLQNILLMHNLTPRNCLGFKIPTQALLQQLGLDINISFRKF